jgi:hypothetical protein
MTIVTVSYLVYVTISITLTIWVARTLHRNGRVFLVDAFHGSEQMADSVNHLLVVGFYLINVGFVVLALKYGDKPTDVQTAIEFLSTKIGLVLVVLGAMHFFNMFNFDKMRRKARRHDAAPAATAGDPACERSEVGTPAIPFRRG